MTEYSVCFDCHECIAFDDPSIDHHIKRELGDRTGHFTIGEECEEFSWCTCDLCHSSLGGSRHTAILHYQGEPLIIESTDSLDGQRHEITHPEYTSFYEREISAL